MVGCRYSRSVSQLAESKEQLAALANLKLNPLLSCMSQSLFDKLKAETAFGGGVTGMGHKGSLWSGGYILWLGKGVDYTFARA